MLGPHLEVAQRTDPGRDPNKQINEDAAGYQVTRLGHLLVVCDGMGGHAAGQDASQLAVRTIVQMVEAAPPMTLPGVALQGAIAQAGRLVFQMGGTGPQAGRPGSTCVAVLVHAAGAEIAHVGDSRVYVVRRGQSWQLTKDHSVVQQMVDLGALAPEMAAQHPDANKITRALGMKPETDVELGERAFRFEPDDVFVLATDGLCDLVRTEEIGAIVSRAPSLDAAADELVRSANDRGGHDNITVQLARVLGSASAFVPPQAVLAPTLVDQKAHIGPERTLVEPVAARPAGGFVPTVPHVVVSPAHPVPLAATAPQVAPAVAAPSKTHPGGTPSRGGIVALALGFALVGLILVGVFLWWWLRK
jgi:serine/threonine protein phosphatase PrpC